MTHPRQFLHRYLARLRKRHYYRRLLKLYRSPLSKPAESYASYERRERAASVQRASARFDLDRKSILASALAHFSFDRSAGQESDRIRGALSALAGMKAAADWQTLGSAIAGILGPGQGADVSPVSNNGSGHEIEARSANDGRILARTILDRVLDRSLAPRFYDYDYLDDVVGIVAGRYCSDQGCRLEDGTSILDALAVLTGADGALDWEALPVELRRMLGNDHGYQPPRGDVTRHVWDVMPDLAAEFIALKAENDVDRFLEINREYSKRQAVGRGLWDNRDLSLLRGYERDHHLLLRTLVALIASGQLSKSDEVLLVGPRYVDEVDFFRTFLGLPRTLGLDLFEYGTGRILAGDMHRMPFEPGRFKLVYCAGTLSYSYNVRRVIDEMARVTARPGFVFLVDAAGRQAGPDALGRSDILGIDTLIGLFWRHSFEVLARDAGRSLAPEQYENEPCLALRLDGAAPGFPRSTDLTRYLTPRP